MADLIRFTRGGRVVTRRSLLRTAAGAAAGAAIIGAPSRSFAAFAQGDSVSGKVTQWCYPLAAGGDQAANEDMWAGLASDFTAQYPDVEVSVEVLPWADRNTKLTTALAAGAGPSVAYLNADFVPQHAGDGNLEPLDDIVAEDPDFAESAVTNLTFDGSLYALPVLGTINTLVHNTALYEQVGIAEYPTTWEELLAAGPAFKDAGLFVTSYMGSMESTLNMSYFPLLWQAGGEVVSEDGKSAAFNSPEGIEALNLVVSLFKEGFTDLDEGLTLPPPDGGKLLEGAVGTALCAGPADVIRFEEAWGAGTTAVAAPLMNKISTSYGTTAGFGVFKGAEDVDAAKAWVKYVCSPEPVSVVLTSGGYIPTRTSLADLYADDPIVSQFLPFQPQMHGDVKHREARQIISTLTPFIQAAFLEKQSVEDALAQGADEVNRFLERG